MKAIRGISLRPVQRGDLQLILALFGDVERAHLWGQRRVGEEEQLLETWRVWSQQRIGAKFMVIRQGRAIGLVFDYERSPEDGHTKVVTLLVDHPAARGAGPLATVLFAEWLFQNVPLRKVCFDVYEFNAPVVRMMHKLGLPLEMQRREHRYWNGRYWDQLGFGLTRRELPPLLARLSRRHAASALRQDSEPPPQRVLTNQAAVACEDSLPATGDCFDAALLALIG